jgi:hypothetical protein
MEGSEFRVNRKHKIEKGPFGNAHVLRVAAAVPAAVNYSITLTTARTYRSAGTISCVHSNGRLLLAHKFKSQPLLSLGTAHHLLTRPSLTYICQIDMLVKNKKKNFAQLRGLCDVHVVLEWRRAVIGQQGKKCCCFKQLIDRYVCLLETEIYWPQPTTLQTA